MQGINWKNIAERAIWTFVQAFIGVFVAGVLLIKDRDSALALMAAALAAGASALKTFVKETL